MNSKSQPMTFATLPAKAFNVLRLAGITSQQQMDSLTMKQIMAMPNAGLRIAQIILSAQSQRPKQVERPRVDIRLKTEVMSKWLNQHGFGFGYGLRSVADAEKLYDYWQSQPGMPEFAQKNLCIDNGPDADTLRQHHINAIGYSPLD